MSDRRILLRGLKKPFAFCIKSLLLAFFTIYMLKSLFCEDISVKYEFKLSDVINVRILSGNTNYGNITNCNTQFKIRLALCDEIIQDSDGICQNLSV